MIINKLSKGIGKTNREVIEVLARLGHPGLMHSHNIDNSLAAKVMREFGFEGEVEGISSAPAIQEKRRVVIKKKDNSDKIVANATDEMTSGISSAATAKEMAEAQNQSQEKSDNRKDLKELNKIQNDTNVSEEVPKKKKFTAVFRGSNSERGISGHGSLRQNTNSRFRVVKPEEDKIEKEADKIEKESNEIQESEQVKTQSDSNNKQPAQESSKIPSQPQMQPKGSQLQQPRSQNQQRQQPRNANRPQAGRDRNMQSNRQTSGSFRNNRNARPTTGTRSSGTGAAKSFEDATPSKKPGRNVQSKNAYKNKNANDKRHRTEDGPAKGRGKLSKHPFIMPVKQEEAKVEDDIKEIIVPDTLTVRDLALKLKLQPSVIIKKQFLKGQMMTVNTELTFEQAEEIALEYEVLCTREEKIDVIAELLKEDDEDPATLMDRPPVVCVMGHVDHGKTSLLDKIRQTNVTSREAGGITQHIGAYMVHVGDRNITFLDTPGHEAFTAMRMRGAQATDIAVLVVAADDGVMPQTIEAINHAKAAGVEIIVAINKIDKPGANIDRVKQELSEHELIPDDWGGSTTFCNVSAKTGDGISNLLEMILLAADVKELKANPNRHARGLVIEAKLDKGKGPVASILVQKGTLHVGDFVAAGSSYGKVRAMMDDKGTNVKEATPSTPVEILGLDNVPNAGEILVATASEKDAKDFAATFISESKNKLIEDSKQKLSLDDLFSQIKQGDIKELPIIVKADVQGSVEALKQSLTKLSTDEIAVKVIHSGVGAINESDVSLASASNAIIIGFNTKADAMAKSTADHENVDIRLYKVIYQAIDDVEAAMKGMQAPVYEEKVIGHAEVRQLFKASGVGMIAGSYVLDGQIKRGCKARITRDGKQIFDGSLASLKRFKDDVKEVNAGYECGLVFEGFGDLAEGDQVEAYDMVEVLRD